MVRDRLKLEAGVVDLRWREGDCTAGDACWVPVPTGNLLRRNQVPEPSSLALIGLALVLSLCSHPVLWALSSS